jgi:hypothetical protein
MVLGGLLVAFRPGQQCLPVIAAVLDLGPFTENGGEAAFELRPAAFSGGVGHRLLVRPYGFGVRHIGRHGLGARYIGGGTAMYAIEHSGTRYLCTPSNTKHVVTGTLSG